MRGLARIKAQTALPACQDVVDIQVEAVELVEVGSVGERLKVELCCVRVLSKWTATALSVRKVSAKSSQSSGAGR